MSLTAEKTDAAVVGRVARVMCDMTRPYVSRPTGGGRRDVETLKRATMRALRNRGVSVSASVVPAAAGTLYVVATPIGNLDDISARRCAFSGRWR